MVCALAASGKRPNGSARRLPSAQAAYQAGDERDCHRKSSKGNDQASDRMITSDNSTNHQDRQDHKGKQQAPRGDPVTSANTTDAIRRTTLTSSCNLPTGTPDSDRPDQQGHAQAQQDDAEHHEYRLAMRGSSNHPANAESETHHE